MLFRSDINVKRKSVPPLETSNNSPKQFPLTDVQYDTGLDGKKARFLGEMLVMRILSLIQTR